jgi:NAD(P)-dependent dehydrogenase (short-subunit alcohol dehydrogenase family)
VTGKVAIITGASQGIGAGLVSAYRAQGWAVIATARTIPPSEDPDVLTVAGDIADPATADRITGAALERFGRIDTLVNAAGIGALGPVESLYNPRARVERVDVLGGLIHEYHRAA